MVRAPGRYHSKMNISEKHLLKIAMAMAQTGATRDQIIETIEIAKSANPQRLLTDEEYNVFAGAVARAVDIMPAFRDAIALIRPFRDYTAPTLYTDRFSRVGIGSYFFLPGNGPIKRASLLLHEAMHVLNNHFTRSVSFPIVPEDNNAAQDLEINSILIRQKGVVIDDGLLPADEPYRFPEMQSYEQYALLMKNKGLLKDPDGAGEQEDQQPQQGTPDPDAPNDPGSPGVPSSPSDSVSSESQPSDSGESGEPSEGSPQGSSSSPSQNGGEPKDSSDPSEIKPGDAKDGSDAESDGSEGSASGGSESDSEGESNSKSDSANGESDPEELADRAIEKIDSSAGQRQRSEGSACEPSTSETEQIADDLKVERASSSEQAVARNNTVARVREEAAKSKERGDRGALMLLQKLELAMEPSKVDWKVIFRNIISRSRDAIAMGRNDHTYRRVNRRLSSGEFVFPGMIRYEPSAIMAIDTSGSMSKDDFAFLLSELETIVKSTLRAKDRFKAFCVDGKATEPKTVKALKDLDLRGGGGTMMEVAVKSIELLPKKEIPDIFILATDGGTSWPAFKRELLKSKHKYKTVVVITQEMNYEVAKKTLEGIADVIDISENGTGEIGR